jgi:signal transduction histidine kinase/ligand-binding sensor domain-containing protein
MRVGVIRILALLSLLGSFGSITVPRAGAERLPIKSYTTADGLPRDLVLRIRRDSHGFLWFCTGDGLSRFDGYEFKSYGTEHGLSHPFINDLIETRSGLYWVATNGGGACRFNPSERTDASAESRFTVFAVGDTPGANRVNVLCEDRVGQLWAGTDDGLFFLDQARGSFVRVEGTQYAEVYSLSADRIGSLWAGTNFGLRRRLPDGRMIKYSIRPNRAAVDTARALLEDRKGNLWVGHLGAGVLELNPEHLPAEDCRLLDQKSRGLLKHYTTADGLANDIVNNLYQSLDDHIWIRTEGGLCEFDGRLFRTYTTEHGLILNSAAAMTEDRDGNLWLSSDKGVMKITRNGFTSFDKSDGLAGDIVALLETNSGELCAITRWGWLINRFENGKFIPTEFNIEESIRTVSWGYSQKGFQDRKGEWWVPTTKGLLRFPRIEKVEQLDRARPKALHKIMGEQEIYDIFHMFEDSRGDIWVGANKVDLHLMRWDRATESFQYYTESDGLPKANLPSAFCEDRSGNLWIGFFDGGLARYTAGRFTYFTPEDGLPRGRIFSIYLDRSDRLWIASAPGGLARIDDTLAGRPSFIKLTTADGLLTNNVYCVTEDRWGHIYAGTSRGIDCLDTATGTVRHYTSADGLAGGQINIAFRDRNGALWFAGIDTLSRLIPVADVSLEPPAILITGLRVAGVPLSVSDLGEADMRGLEFKPSQNHVQIDFVALAFGAGETLRYQYKLEGADADWQIPTALRTVNYASLAPGVYRFVVRAMNAEGIFSPSPAVVEFRVLAPVWRRWWFLSIAAALVIAAAYALYRYRLARLLEFERVRTRIASDLHDDIGANLTRIAILSEVANRQLRKDQPGLGQPLSSIADISRESVASMSDIIWAINPKRDNVHDLVQRMRRFAEEVLTGRDIEVEFRAPDAEDGLKAGADLRRDLFLIFKEAVNNAARHSGCSRVEIELRVDRSIVVLSVRDDGRGFVTESLPEGNGLVSMKRRAASLGGDLRVKSIPGQSTEIIFKAPYR